METFRARADQIGNSLARYEGNWKTLKDSGILGYEHSRDEVGLTVS